MKTNAKLTKREVQVLSLLSSGLNDKNIALTLSLSIRTVQNHLSRIYIKYRVKNRTQAAAKFLSEFKGEDYEKNYSTLECG